jgi:anti-anti-sigma regulatory factor
VEIRHTNDGSLNIIHLDGQFAYGDDKRLSEFTTEIASKGQSTIAIDITKMTYLSSTEISSLMALLKIADEYKCEFLIYGINQGILAVLEKIFSHNYIPVLTEEEFKERYL